MEENISACGYQERLGEVQEVSSRELECRALQLFKEPVSSYALVQYVSILRPGVCLWLESLFRFQSSHIKDLRFVSLHQDLPITLSQLAIKDRDRNLPFPFSLFLTRESPENNNDPSARFTFDPPALANPCDNRFY